MSLRVSLAGQLKVEAGGRTLEGARLAGRQGRVVFAYLVAERDHPVPSEELAEVVWGARPPPTWRPALRGTVSKVRTFLGALKLPAADMLTSSSGCYLLSLPDDATVDVELAVGEADAATRALAAGDLARALEAAQAARRIAGQPLLPGIEGAWVERRRTLLHDTLVRSLEVLVDAHLAAGRGGLGTQPARELVALEPFRESAHLRLLRALAASGDRGEALRVYERCRRLLAEELGVDPSTELEAAYLAVLRAEPAAATAVPPVPVEAIGVAGGFVGRARELARLRAAWNDVRAGRRRSTVVAGEAGIGKSRLLTELADLAERDGAIVLSGRCDEQVGASYLPVRQALGDYLAGYPRNRLPALVGPRGGELFRFWPELAWRVPGLQGLTRGGPDAERYLLFEAVSALLEAIAATGPVVLVIDDLHWADEASLLLLRHIALAPRPDGLFILVACRNDEEPRAELDATLGDLLRAPRTERLVLGGLETSEVAELAETTLGRPLGPGGAALARVLRERTMGNPFFAGELLRHLSETGDLASADAARLAAGPASDDIPEPVRLIMGRRIARLGPQVERVLGVAAVIGHHFDLAVLSRVTDLGYDELLAAVETAVRARLLDERAVVPGGYTFHHAIVHDLVYADLPAARRAVLHHLVGVAIEGLHGGTPHLRELADHFALGHTRSDAVKAVDYATRAGDRALIQLLYEEAARRYRQALAAVDRAGCGDQRRCDLLLALGDALARAGQATRAADAYLEAAGTARLAGLAYQLARAALGIGGPTAFWALDRDAVVALLREALAAVGPEDSPTRALLLGRMAGWQAAALGLAEPAGEQPSPSHDEAVAMARRLGDPRTVAAVLADHEFALGGVVLERPGGPAAALSASAELDRLAGELDDDFVFRATLARAEALAVAGDLGQLDRLCGREERIANDRRLPHRQWLPLVHRAARAVMRGEFADGERLAERALSVGRSALGAAAVVTHGAQLVFLRWLQGRHDEMAADLHRLSEQPPELGWSKLQLLVDAARGRTAATRHAVDAAALNGFVGWRGNADVLALTAACALLGDVRRAAWLYPLLLPWKGWHLGGTSVYFGAADYHLGILAATADHFEDAERHLWTAMAAHRRLGARPWVALTEHAYAGMLRRRDEPGDRVRAATADAAARKAAAALGMRLGGG